MMEDVTDIYQSDDNSMAWESIVEDLIDQITGMGTDSDTSENQSTNASVDESSGRKTLYSLRTTRKPPRQCKDAARGEL